MPDARGDRLRVTGSNVAAVDGEVPLHDGGMREDQAIGLEQDVEYALVPAPSPADRSKVGMIRVPCLQRSAATTTRPIHARSDRFGVVARPADWITPEHSDI